MKVILCYSFIIILTLLSCSCSNQFPKGTVYIEDTNTFDIPPIINKNAIIEVNKTSKYDMINMLGEPNSISTGEDYTCFTYNIINNNEVWNITFVEADGFTLHREYRKGYYFAVYFNKNGKVRNFSG